MRRSSKEPLRPLRGSSPRPATSSWTPVTTTGCTTGFADPWEDEIIEEGAKEWRRASALMDSVGKLTDWMEEDLPAASPRCWTSSCPGSPNK